MIWRVFFTFGSAVAEHSSDLAEKVYTDPTTSQGHLKENLKAKVKGVVASGEQISSEAHAKEKADEVAKVVSKVKHFGKLGEDYLGYEDPNKDIRKAVKAKEKAAKKARKAKKKKTGKKEDLFDPENLAKFKLELEERKKREAEFLNDQEEVDAEDVDEHSDQESDKKEDEEEKEFKFTLELDEAGFASVPGAGAKSGKSSTTPTPLRLKSPLTPIKTHTDDQLWFESLTAGVDAVIKKKTEELADIKVDSYFQKKSDPVAVEGSDTEAASAEAGGKKKKGKKWVDLDKAGFDDLDGSVSGTDNEVRFFKGSGTQYDFLKCYIPPS